MTTKLHEVAQALREKKHTLDDADIEILARAAVEALFIPNESLLAVLRNCQFEGDEAEVVWKTAIVAILEEKP
jgi:hypothetical protein